MLHLPFSLLEFHLHEREMILTDREVDTYFAILAGCILRTLGEMLLKGCACCACHLMEVEKSLSATDRS